VLNTSQSAFNLGALGPRTLFDSVPSTLPTNSKCSGNGDLGSDPPKLTSNEVFLAKTCGKKTFPSRSDFGI